MSKSIKNGKTKLYHMISYKNNKEEEELYKWLDKKSGRSGFVKELLKKEKIREETQNSKIKQGFFTIE